MWAEADPTSAGSPDRRASLATAVRDLADAGLVAASKATDSTGSPPLPTRLTLPKPAAGVTAAAVARATVWRPELSWVLRARVSMSQVEQLQRINSWLRDHGHERDVIPIRERSLQMLGHEKALDALATGSMFAAGRLSLDILRTFRTHPPLPAVRIGDGPCLLVVENDNTFHSVRVALADDPGPVGWVAWGAGGAFQASVRTCADLAGVAHVRYFGDLDAAGVQIPRNAAELASREGLPPVEPAAGLYRALLTAPYRQTGQARLSEEHARALSAWFRNARLPGVAEAVSELLCDGVRIAQEALDGSWLRRDRAWMDGLGRQ